MLGFRTAILEQDLFYKFLVADQPPVEHAKAMG